MRPFLTILLLTIALHSEAQTGLPVYHPAGMGLGYHPGHGFGWTDPAKKWSLQPYAAFNSGFMFYGGGGASYFSTPIGLQLTRRLNDNLYAFGAVSVTPTYMNLNNSSFMKSPMGLNLYQRAEMGLMYVNDARTFSISGSIGVQSGGNPFYPVGPTGYTKPANTPISHR